MMNTINTTQLFSESTVHNKSSHCVSSHLENLTPKDSFSGKGLFITFEGIEGSGKTTQIIMLVEVLKAKGIPYVTTREPGGTKISEAIRDLLLNPEFMEMKPETELQLYCASRAQHTAELILPALEEGKIVISDRYFDSTYAYQGAARELDEEVINVLTRFSTYGRNPDLTFLLDLPVEVGLARIKNRNLDRLEQETLSFHEKVRRQFLSIANKYPSRYIVLNGESQPEIIHRQIISTLQPFIGE